MTQPVRDPGSFRDPAGHVYYLGGDVLRTLSPDAAQEYDAIAATGLHRSLQDRGLLIASDEIAGPPIDGVHRVLKHPKLSFISYPYEWPFPLLKSAALAHLTIQLEALDRNVVLSDATAYNLQFSGTSPIFIDVLSFRRYSAGEHWDGHRQFCEQFLNPLLLRAKLGVPHNAWFRGSLEGIASRDLALLLPWRSRLSPTIQTNVILPAKAEAKALLRDVDAAGIRKRELPKNSYKNILLQLQHFVEGLNPRDTGATVWGDYEEEHTYHSAEEQRKRAFIAEFSAKVRPSMLWDLGCNTGAYSEVALMNGAKAALGFDFDQRALERAYIRATAKRLNFTPLFQDGANQTPDQGWAGAERKGLRTRAPADAVLALAFEHHLAIGKNIPLPSVVEWIVSLAPAGVVEFVQKSDPTIQKMLALREDIFPSYTEAEFENALRNEARVIRSTAVSEQGRKLFWFDRS